MSGVHPITIRVVRTVSGTGRPVVRIGVGYKKRKTATRKPATRRTHKGSSWKVTGSRSSGGAVKYHRTR